MLPIVSRTLSRSGLPPVQWWALVVGLGLLTSCGEGLTTPGSDGSESPAPQMVIQDGAHNAGNAHVFFLPPLVPSPTPNGTFDPTLSPKIEICPSDLTGCTGPALLTMVSGEGGDVRLDAENEHYIANWHTDESGVVAGNHYRIRVLQGSAVLAIADVLITGSGQGKNAETGEYFALKDGRTLPIKVRIEEGAAATAPAEAGSEDGKAAIAVPAGAVEEYVEITVEPVDPEDPPEPLPPPTSGTALPGTIYNFTTDQESVQFSQPVELALALPASLPEGVSQAGLRVYFAGPKGWEMLPGTVDITKGVVTGLTTHLSTYAILPSEVTSCNAQGATGFDTIAEALAAVGPGGTITVCGGNAPTVDSVGIAKPVTIEGETGSRPVIQSTVGRASFFVEGVDSGTVTFRNLAFENMTSHPPSNYSVYARTVYDQVVIDDVTFTTQAGNTGGVIAIASSVPGAGVTIQNSSFSGGGLAVNVVGTRVDLSNSTVQDHATYGLLYQNATGTIQGNTMGPNCGGGNCVRITGASSNVNVLGNDLSETRTGLVPTHRVVYVLNGATGRIEDNDFLGCGGEGQCVFGWGGGMLEVVNNRFTIDGTHETGMAVHGQANGTTLLVTDNTITGVGAGSSGYGVKHCALEVEEGAVLTAHRNTMTNVRAGICGYNGGIVADAQDNVIDNVQAGFGVYLGSQVTATFNDITNIAGGPIDMPDSDPALSDLSCNWWGSVTGPANGAGLPTTLFTPWAVGPIAGTDHSGCVSVVTVSTSPDPGNPLEVGTFGEALALITPGGTIKVAAGAHAVDSVSVDKPLTIEGAGLKPVLQLTTGRSSFFVEAVASGTVTFRNLAFQNATTHPGPGSNYSIYARTTYDQVVIDDVTFATQTGNTGGVIAIASGIPGAGVAIQNSSFSGGGLAVNVLGTRVDVSNSTVQDHATYGLLYQNATGTIQGNAMGPNCGGGNCIRITGASSNVTVIGNDLTETRTGLAVTHRVVYVLNGATGRIEDNDFLGCGGEGQCVFGWGGGMLEVVNNRFTVHGSHETGMAVHGQANGTTLLVTDNTITGVGAGTSGYGVKHCALEVEEGAVLTAHRNTMSNVRAGICGYNGGIVADARDNVIDNVQSGFGVYLGSQVTARFNDITNIAGGPIDMPDSDPALSNLTCNWWGSVTGPLNGVGLPTTLFTPWAMVPIANTGASGC